MTSRWARYRPGTPRGPWPDGLVVREARPIDCPEIARITHERDGVDLAAARERCGRDLRDPDRLLVVAEVGGELAGFARAGRWEPPSDGPENAAPAGWYLFGVIVRDRWRRRGIGLELTRRRLAWIADRAGDVYYFANARNAASIDLHGKLGFVEVTRDFTFPGMSFEGGVGILFHVDVRRTDLIGTG
jgi:ribosomal protein S18 acetylase RimI-like enzyme